MFILFYFRLLMYMKRRYTRRQKKQNRRTRRRKSEKKQKGGVDLKWVIAILIPAAAAFSLQGARPITRSAISTISNEAPVYLIPQSSGSMGPPKLPTVGKPIERQDDSDKPKYEFKPLTPEEMRELVGHDKASLLGKALELGNETPTPIKIENGKIVPDITPPKQLLAELDAKYELKKMT
jgi:hypothetical protein